MSTVGDEKTRERIKNINSLHELSRKKRKTKFREQASSQIKIAREIKYASVR
ncbi:hypothetical protein ACQKPX_23690 [Photobacterium sp. DNB23_23_1]|uniref:Uncharacterized protein n=1 Tax=Photobacterium pectinilyticum TaxID=2906793 RepID=A0ABT1N590_9GAMM|nr:hypothetical protein [Photobacterium sp. ZSDE20]MCQ1059902.1 hypothetical protein [Photobacterium sp. ZSDE20]MDD1826091.1 hypothetical protein [Photobacterium sp. ZSDE20]